MNSKFADVLSSEEFKEEFVVAETQARLSTLMEEKGFSRAELARQLGVSRARVTQIFSDEAQNFTLRLLVRSFLALGEEPVLLSRSEYNDLNHKAKGEGAGSAPMTRSSVVTDGMAEALIAKLLQASVGEPPVSGSEKAEKRSTGARDWAATGSNIIQLRAHG